MSTTITGSFQQSLGVTRQLLTVLYELILVDSGAAEIRQALTELCHSAQATKIAFARTKFQTGQLAAFEKQVAQRLEAERDRAVIDRESLREIVEDVGMFLEAIDPVDPQKPDLVDHVWGLIARMESKPRPKQ